MIDGAKEQYQFVNRPKFKDTLAMPKSVKKSSGVAKLKSQNSKIRFPVVHDVI